MEEKTEKKEISHTTIINKFSWQPLWTMGFLFTFGITGFTENIKFLSGLGFWSKLFYLIVDYILWPIFLGIYFSHK